MRRRAPHRQTFRNPKGDTGYLEMDAYFRLLEHDELQGARRSSLVATRFATLALIVSVAAFCASIWFSISPTMLAPDQLSTLTQPRPGEASIEAKLDELIRVHNDLLLAVGDDSAQAEAR